MCLFIKELYPICPYAELFYAPVALQKDILDFLYPLVPLEVRMTKDRENRPSGSVYQEERESDCVKEYACEYATMIMGYYV